MGDQRYAEHHDRSTNLTIVIAPAQAARVNDRYRHLVDYPDQPGPGLCARFHAGACRPS
jgi:hypothetical protein